MATSKLKAVKKLNVKLFKKQKEATCGDSFMNRRVKVMNNSRKKADKGSCFRGKLLHERLIKCGEFKKESYATDTKLHDKKKQDCVHKSSRANFQEEAKSAIHKENTCLTFQPTPLATNVAPKGNLIYEIQPCPKRELRTAMLKSRYAEIIVKAQHTNSNHDKTPNPLKIQEEKRKFENIQLEEINKIKYQMENGEDAAGVKSQREKEREATRVALRQMTNTANIYENIWVQREFDSWIGSKDSYY